jgi:hypothetical protein
MTRGRQDRRRQGMYTRTLRVAASPAPFLALLLGWVYLHPPTIPTPLPSTTLIGRMHFLKDILKIRIDVEF